MKTELQKQISALTKMLLAFGVLILAAVFGVFYIKMNPELLQNEESYEAVPIASEEIVLDAETIAQSGFVNDKGVTQVIQNCTQCHSSKLITQNRMSSEGWHATIVWMQETQNLWDLGVNHEKIVTYLAKNYAPERKGRRQNLTNIEWYKLE